MRADVEPQMAMDQLQAQTSAISRISTSSVSATDLLQSYLRWTEEARRGLSSVFGRATVRDLVENDHYWFLRGATDRNIRVIPAIIGELDDRSRAFEGLRDNIAGEIDRWRGKDPHLLVVPDTSMFMGKHTNFADYDWCEVTGSEQWHRIVIPLRVLDELDGLKDRGSDGQKRQARTMIKWLDEHLPDDPRQSRLLELVNTTARVTLEVVTFEEQQRSDADMVIIQTAKQLSQFGDRPVVVVTRDLGQKVRGQAVGQRCAFVPTPVDAP